MLYTLIIQEQQGDYWFDLYKVDNDRRIAEEFLKVIRDKHKDRKYRIVRLIQ